MLRVRFRYEVRVGFVVSAMVKYFGTFSRLILFAQHLQTVTNRFRLLPSRWCRRFSP